MIKDDFAEVVKIYEAGGPKPNTGGHKLSPEAIAVMMAGPNQMGPGMKKKPPQGEPAAKL